MTNRHGPVPATARVGTDAATRVGTRIGTAGTAGQLRDCLVALAALNTVGVAVELATLRHWQSAVQLIPWGALALLGCSIGLLLLRPSRQTLRTVRILSAGVGATAALGVIEHVAANYRAGPLYYGHTWATTPAAARLWAALTKTVGSAPSFAPAVLGFAALCLWFATLRHPLLNADAPAPVIRTATFTVDLSARRITTTSSGAGGGAEVRLTRIEWRLLQVLLRQPGKPVPQHQLLHEVWGPAKAQQAGCLRVSIAELRRKLEPDPNRPRHLLTQPDMGYRFEPDLPTSNGSRPAGTAR
jgi:DNA-binding winged helix-turn-helix (wHTH) protein